MKYHGGVVSNAVHAKLPAGVPLLQPGTAWLAQTLPSSLFHFVTAQSCFVEGQLRAREEHIPGSLRDD